VPDVRRVEDRDRPWIRQTVAAAWGSPRVVSRGRVTEDASILDGFVAEVGGHPAGLAMTHRDDDRLEVVALIASKRFQGVGTALLRAVEDEAARLGCRAWLITMNDNLDAIRFYQRRGWDWVAFHRDAATETRRLKPELPELGDHGIPLRHELEFEAPSA
jgi:GNAT superfamily N-acetyltransferase